MATEEELEALMKTPDPKKQLARVVTEEELEALMKTPDPKKQLARVVLESPYAGDVAANVDYARACMADCLGRGEAPIASHLLYTQDGVLDDEDGDERAKGIAAGFAWGSHANMAVFYVDRGWGPGMRAALLHWLDLKVPCQVRSLQSTFTSYTISPGMRGLPFHKIADLLPLCSTEPTVPKDKAKFKRRLKGDVGSKQDPQVVFDKDAGETADEVVTKFCDAARGAERPKPKGVLIPLLAVDLVQKLRRTLADVGDTIKVLGKLDVSVGFDIWHNEGSESMVLNDLTGEFNMRAWWRKELDPQHEEPQE